MASMKTFKRNECQDYASKKKVPNNRSKYVQNLNTRPTLEFINNGWVPPLEGKNPRVGF